MQGVNQATIIGLLGSDVELHRFNDGGCVANLSVATSHSWKDSDGNRQERTEWHRVILRNRYAEIAEKYMKKGSKVYIQGEMQTRKYTDKDGIDRYVTEIHAKDMEMLDGPNAQ